MYKTKQFIKKVFLFCLSIIIIGFTGITFAQNEFYDSPFYQRLLDINIPIRNILEGTTISRYDLTRLLNAVECQDCIIPTENFATEFHEGFWNIFKNTPGKYFSDIGYLDAKYNGTNYYYCVAKVGNGDIMNGYPTNASDIRGGKFYGHGNVDKAQFFQTISNLLLEYTMRDYSANWQTIKTHVKGLNKSSAEYQYFNELELNLINSKNTSSYTQISNKLEFTAYLKYCTFNPEECNFKTFPELGKGTYPLAQANVLINANIITENDVTALGNPITPADALRKIQLVYELYTKCEFNNDYDCDSIPNTQDNCPYTYNPAQSDLDGDNIGDVCDQDIDGDGIGNPAGLVDDNGILNYNAVKREGCDDTTPLGDQVDDTAFFIKITSLSQTSPTEVKFTIEGKESPANVERDFGDVATGKGRSVSHYYNVQGVYTITAKVTSQSRKEYILSTQIYLGGTSSTSYRINISDAEIPMGGDTGTFSAIINGDFDTIVWKNSAIGTEQTLNKNQSFTTKLIAGTRNNIIVKGYVNNMLVASASTDVYSVNGDFISFVPIFTPEFIQIGSVNVALKPIGTTPSFINAIRRDFGEGYPFQNSSSNSYYQYEEKGFKNVIQQIEVKNSDIPIFNITSSITVQNPATIGNQTYNILPSFSTSAAELEFKAIGLNLTNSDKLQTTVNGQTIFSSNNISDGNIFTRIDNKKGVLKINSKLYHGNISLENKGIVAFGTNQEENNRLQSLSSLFEGYHCDLDRDGVPDKYDDDIDEDGIPNLLGMIIYERDDCKLIPGDNVDLTLYNKHFGVCSLDNCPFRSNASQLDLNNNGVGDICESDGICGDKIIDPGEDCTSCPSDVGSCSAVCGNGLKEIGENCKNCPEDAGSCPEKCGNRQQETGEECDYGSENGKNGICTITCKRFNTQKPNCGNGKIDEGETCQTCPEDLQDLCVEKGDNIKGCGNRKIDEGETCLTCPEDVGTCTATCENNTKEEAENCKNCPGDAGNCPEKCGNNKKENGEECDDGDLNGQENCRINCTLWPNNNRDGDSPITLCGNGVIDPGETCQSCSMDLQDICIKSGKGVCGNGIIEEGETCLNCPQDVGACNAFCGDGIVQEAEDCLNCPKDIGSCKGSCGNEVKEPGEECDSGIKNGYDGFCSTNCRIIDPNQVCGNNVQESGEECDKNNGKEGSDCTIMCTKKDWLHPNCGNGTIDSGETCLTCPTDLGEKCIAKCGNGKIEQGEQCDNGNNNGHDGKCSFTCQKVDTKDKDKYCGNNKKDVTGEMCDKGVQNGGNECTINCLTPNTTKECGNGKIEDKEACDNGSKNGTQGNNCSTQCKEISTCGNGKIDPGEDCSTCPKDLKDICVQEGNKKAECGNGEIEDGETCLTCPNDVGKCDGKCGDGIIQASENCNNCPKDVGVCQGSCGNGEKEPGEECDHGRDNGKDGKCSPICTIVDSNIICGDGSKKSPEECDKGNNNGKPSSKCTLKCTKYDENHPNCGNGVIEPGEDCLNCPIDLGTKCVNTCGNGITEGGEECDNGKFNGKDGKCSFECKIVTNGHYCGDNNRDSSLGEECDNGNDNGSNGKCTDDCRKIKEGGKPICGDGKKEGNEECDYGTKRNGTVDCLCTSDCKALSLCGNKEKDGGEDCETCPQDLGGICIDNYKGVCGDNMYQEGETCLNCPDDLGECTGFCGNENIEEAESCRSCAEDVGACQGSCGNGEKEPGEECDHGAHNGFDGICSKKCNIVDPNNICGDGNKSKEEECDQGEMNGIGTSTCSKMCTFIKTDSPLCGNGIIDENEDCYTCPVDLGDKCYAYCGNGKVENGEICDHGKNNGYDGKCSFECKKITNHHYCGDANVDTDLGETCDEGTIKNGHTNTCSATCQNISPTKIGNPRCGNGIIETSSGEECDNGDKNNGKDGICNAQCKRVNSCKNKQADSSDNCEECDGDIGDACIQQRHPSCGNETKEKGEDCTNCPQDIGECTGKCGNNKIEPGETCLNCPQDVGACQGSCGNGALEGGEECDNGSYNGKDGKCSKDCKIVDPNQICGNNNKEGSEDCDLGNRNGKVGSDCTIKCNTATRPNCGNGVIDDGENCETCEEDLGEICSVTCGDGIIGDGKNNNYGEECDNGPLNGHDGICSFTCQKINGNNPTKMICGNKEKEPANQEDCDHGPLNGVDNECDKDCKNVSNPECGNGKQENGEDCDYGTARNGKNGICTTTCEQEDDCKKDNNSSEYNCQKCAETLKDLCVEKYTGECGDGILESDEDCNNCVNDAKNCTGKCGNGIVESGETCLTCPNDAGMCKGSCGNKNLEDGEECDNGMNNGYDGICSKDCKLLIKHCGNSNKESQYGEDCDNGNSNGKEGDNCTKKCTNYDPKYPNCGDGDIDPGENCDTCKTDLGEKCIVICGDGILGDGIENEQGEVINKFGEECDNGKNNGKDGKCSFECKVVTDGRYCGDGNVDKDLGETCDDGIILNGHNKKCDSNCRKVTSPTCGNGIQEGSEQCDLGELNGEIGGWCSKGCAITDECKKEGTNKNCENCPEELKEKCVEPATVEEKCGDDKVTGTETCETCEKDTKECSATCGNGIVEDAEDCTNCPTDVGACIGSCGNNILEDNEECDHGGANGHDGKCSKQCKVVNPNAYCGDGTPNNNEACDLGKGNGIKGSKCTVKCTIYDILNPNCGNETIDYGETCQTCPIDLGEKCGYVCGNNIHESKEQCDHGSNNGHDGICSFSCSILGRVDPDDPTTILGLKYCGNRITETELQEECDEGSGVNGITSTICDKDCWKIRDPKCGDGILNSPSEQCDEGPFNGADGVNCTTNCTYASLCGNGEIDPGENCETCPKDLKEKCVTKIHCGDGILDTDKSEECDNGKWNGIKGNCNKDCKIINLCGNGVIDEGETCKTCPQDVGECSAKCGDGIVQEAEDCENCPEDVGGCKGSCGNGDLEEGEECDHGKNNGKDRECTTNCKKIIDPNKPYCGDGNIDKDLGEQCDNGSENGRGLCSFICTTVPSTAPSTCGDGKINPGENCDNCAADLGNKCVGICGNNIVNKPGEDCDNGNKNGINGLCTRECKKTTGICGNGKTEDDEECDDGNNNGKNEHCTIKCSLFNAELPTCGNGSIDEGENCKNCPIDVGECPSSCGNGKKEANEECDNGKLNNGKDGICSKDCRFVDTSHCGNSRVENEFGEECDHGNINGKDGKCSYNCQETTSLTCGNGTIEANEDCYTCPIDLGTRCQGECGDGEIDSKEQCDNGSENGKDGICDINCQDVDPCGNGEIDPGEKCDNCAKDLKSICIDDGSSSCGNEKADGNENCVTCENDIGSCTASCGNNNLEPGEECDHGMNNGKDGLCSADCKDLKSKCGDGKHDDGEECDQGTNNGNSTHGCTINCRHFDPENPTCGDGVVQLGETCQTCPIDLGERCIVKCGDNKKEGPEECDLGKNNGPESTCTQECKSTTNCGNNQVDPGETCETCPEDVPICDKDGDGCPDDRDQCPEIPGFTPGECCPSYPDEDPTENIPLVKSICNSCPCQFSDYNNTLQNDDIIRARLRDKSRKVHYNYSEDFRIGNILMNAKN